MKTFGEVTLSLLLNCHISILRAHEWARMLRQRNGGGHKAAFQACGPGREAALRLTYFLPPQEYGLSVRLGQGVFAKKTVRPTAQTNKQG